MVRIWQTEIGLLPKKDWVNSMRKIVGLALTPRRSPFSDPSIHQSVFQHREALVKLGFFSERIFPLKPVSLSAPEYKQLCDRVAAQTGQQPTARLEYDQPASPSNVLGLTVYTTPEDVTRWEHFVKSLALTNASNKIDF